MVPGFPIACGVSPRLVPLESILATLTNIVAADEDEIQAVGESLHPLDEWSGIERRGIDSAKIISLHSLLSHDAYDDAMKAAEPVYVSSEGAVVLRIADDVMQKLATFDEEALTRVAEELAASEAFELENWEAEHVLTMVLELGALAELAESQGQVLLVWMHPLLT